MKKIYLFFILVIFLIGFISAFPGFPNQFYGNVFVNDLSADNNIVKAIVNGEEYITISDDGRFGYSPNLFFVEDPNSENARSEVSFYVGGKYAGKHTFENGELTFLNFSLTTFCGDSYCLGEETCTSCSDDCGICTEPPVINILSPTANEVYKTSEIDLNVSSDQEIVFWRYSLNSGSKTIFSPNARIEVVEGTNTLVVFGMNDNNQNGQASVTFSVDLPECGDGVCDSIESCSSCVVDCGACVSTSSSGGGSGGSKKTLSTLPANNTTTINNIVTLSDTSSDSSANENEEETNSDVKEEETEMIEDNRGTNISGITGAVVGFAKSGIGIGIIVFVLVIALSGVFIVVRKNRKYTPEILG